MAVFKGNLLRIIEKSVYELIIFSNLIWYKIKHLLFTVSELRPLKFLTIWRAEINGVSEAQIALATLDVRVVILGIGTHSLGLLAIIAWKIN